MSEAISCKADVQAQTIEQLKNANDSSDMIEQKVAETIQTQCSHGHGHKLMPKVYKSVG